MPTATLEQPMTDMVLSDDIEKPQRKPIEAVSIICSKGTLDMAYPGLILANVLLELLSVSMPFLPSYDVRPSVVAGGLLVGILTTLIFGMVAIVRASHRKIETFLALT